jgi:hypothetical protein
MKASNELIEFIHVLQNTRKLNPLPYTFLELILFIASVTFQVGSMYPFYTNSYQSVYIKIM